MLKLLVKGNKFQTAHAASNRKIPFVFIKEHNKEVETFGLVGDQFEDLVQAWFCEIRSWDCAPGTGYPVGTLLFYNPVKPQTI